MNVVNTQLTQIAKYIVLHQWHVGFKELIAGVLLGLLIVFWYLWNTLGFKKGWNSFQRNWVLILPVVGLVMYCECALNSVKEHQAKVLHSDYVQSRLTKVEKTAPYMLKVDIADSGASYIVLSKNKHDLELVKNTLVKVGKVDLNDPDLIAYEDDDSTTLIKLERVKTIELDNYGLRSTKIERTNGDYLVDQMN